MLLWTKRLTAADKNTINENNLIIWETNTLRRHEKSENPQEVQDIKWLLSDWEMCSINGWNFSLIGELRQCCPTLDWVYQHHTLCKAKQNHSNVKNIEDIYIGKLTLAEFINFVATPNVKIDASLYEIFADM